MNTEYILEVLDELGNELMNLHHENWLMKEKFDDNMDYSGYGVCCTIEKRLTRISNLLQHIQGTIEEEDLRLYEIESQI